jgi:hypothetical protein
MVGEAWLRHATPDRYTRETLDLSADNLRQIAGDVLKSAPPGLDTASTRTVLERSRRRIVQMARFVEARNSPAFAGELDSLRADQKIVKQLSDSIDSERR